MIDYMKTHRCLLTEVASGDAIHRGRLTQTVQALILSGFLSGQKNVQADGAIIYTLTLTAAGHQYLAGLWH